MSYFSKKDENIQMLASFCTTIINAFVAAGEKGNKIIIQMTKCQLFYKHCEQWSYTHENLWQIDL